jgi:dTDP-4-dehydrorhamnose reductase
MLAHRHKAPWLIIRTTVLFGEAENNFVGKIVNQLEQGKKPILYQPELRGSPTYIPALAKEIIRITKAEYTGIAHIAGRKLMTRLDFARLIASTFGFNPGYIIATDATPGGAPRPPRAGLISDHSGYMRIYSHSAIEGLQELAERYKRGNLWK